MDFFSGSWNAKLDDKGRFVLPQPLRYALAEGKMDFTFSIGLGLGGCLGIYKQSAIQKIVEKFQKKQHLAKYQPFFTMFFSTLHQTSCDKLGRCMIPAFLKESVHMKREIVIAGVLNKIEIWPKATYDQNMQKMLLDGSLTKMTEEAFALLGEEEEGEEAPMQKLTENDLALIETE